MPIRRQHRDILPAKNQRLTEVARSTIQDLARVRRQANRAAIEAQGYPVTVYTRLTHGVRCTCSYTSQSLLDEEGNLNQAEIDNLLDLDGVQIKDYGSKNSRLITGADENENKSGDGNDFTYTVDSEDEKGGPISNYRRNSEKADEADLDLSEMNEDFDSERLYSRGNVSCAVCYGTGYVGGFSLLNGIHRVYDTQAGWKLEGGAPNKSVAPNTIELFSSGVAEVTVVFPKGATGGLYPKLFNNKDEVPYSKYVVTLDDNVVSSANILSFCTGLPQTLKIKAVADLEFTHLDTAFRVGHTYASFPDVNIMYEIEKVDPISNVSISLPGDYNVAKGSIVIDHLRGLSRGWRVSGVTKANDTYGVVSGWQAEARVLEKYELSARLRPIEFAEPGFSENRRG